MEGLLNVSSNMSDGDGLRHYHIHCLLTNTVKQSAGSGGMLGGELVLQAEGTTLCSRVWSRLQKPEHQDHMTSSNPAYSIEL